MFRTALRGIAIGLAVIVTSPLLSPSHPSALGPSSPLIWAQEEDKPPEKSEKKKKRGRKKKGKADSSKSEKKDAKPFDEVVKDMERIEGLFTFYVDRDEGKVFMEIQPDQIDKNYLLSPTLETGLGEGSIALLAATVFPEYIVRFHKVAKNIQFLIPNIWFRADESPEMERAVSRGFSDSLLAQVKLASLPHTERKSYLVDLNKLFLRDLEGIQLFLKQTYKTGYTFDKDASHIGTLKGFPRNVGIQTIQHFKTEEPKRSITLPDPRSMFLTFEYNLSELPDSGFRPRLADDRVGHFTTIFQDYSSMRRESPYVRYVQRWHLEKQEPSADLSPAKEPIVFWLENTIPPEYRDAIREGTLAWNIAFEKIGIQDAIAVKEQPDDAEWDASDIRYNTLRWIVAPGAGFAQGPSRANPFTGQLFDADIRFSADMIRNIWAEHEEFVNPVAMLEPPVLENVGHGRGPAYLCNYLQAGSLQAAFGFHLLASRGTLFPNSVEARQYVHDFLVHVTLHEVGHTLGLRHNFKASSIYPVDQLQNADMTIANGLTGSVMDYTPVNLATNGSPQGQYWQTTPGPYDYWAIEYAYKPIDADSPEGELDELERIASRVAQANLAYATDEDTFGFSPRSIDPTSNLWDIGDDPIRFYEGRIELAQELWGNIEEVFEKPGNRYQKFRRVFGEGISQYAVAALNVPKFIGGIYHHRDHIGDPGGRVPFEPVSVEKQRAALDFLREKILAPDALQFTPELLNKLAPERDWDFQGSPWTLQRIDYPIHDMVKAIQSLVLGRLYHPITMSRIVDLEVKYADGADPFTLGEVFSGVRSAIWSELQQGEKINGFRRNLQRVHLDALSRLILDPTNGTPEDAKTLARADLVDIRSEADQVLRAGGLDRMTKAHLAETAARIDATLDAQVQRRLFPRPSKGS